MARAEDDLQRRALESPEALHQDVPAAGRPFGETWWWFLLVTAWIWYQLAWTGVQLVRGQGVEGLQWFALAALVVMLPLFLRTRRSGAAKRAAAPRHPGVGGSAGLGRAPGSQR